MGCRCLGSHAAVAVVQVGSCSSDSTLSLGTSLCHECSPKKVFFKKKKKRKKKRKKGRKKEEGGNLILSRETEEGQ